MHRGNHVVVDEKVEVLDVWPKRVVVGTVLGILAWIKCCIKARPEKYLPKPKFFVSKT